MKELYVTRGNYAGRIISLSDEVAAAALADAWAVEGMPEVPDGTDLSGTLYGAMPQSLLDFEAGIDAGGTSIDAETEPPVPADPPVLDSLDPDTAVLDAPDVTMHCHGTGFTAASVINFADHDEPTVFVSDTEITTVVKPSLSWGEVAVPVFVRNADGVQSAALDFTFTAAA